MKTRRITIFHFLLVFSFVVSFGLLLFSYTQVDLSLTLSQETILQTIQKQFQHIGFYQRPITAGIFLFLLFLMILLYFVVLYAVKKNFLTDRQCWMLILLITGILFFSYPAAFSYDIFNHIFTAKAVLVYKQNPYEVKPLDFQGIDPMLSFMRWTHLPSAYTPLWILLTFVPYMASFGILFFATLTMKLIPIFSYIVCIVVIGTIAKTICPSHRIISMTAFAFHPLVIIEVLVSAHNDIVMMVFALIAYWFILYKNHLASFFLYAISVGIKFITIILLPLFFIGWSPRKAVALLIGALCLVLTRREFLPWYALWILPFVVFMPNSRLFLFIVGVSLGMCGTYLPLFYYGIDPRVQSIQGFITVFSICMSLILALFKPRIPKVVRILNFTHITGKKNSLKV
ncbi:MAG: hypothetical protein N3A54_03960 [Patescibacteria group bacterium]|nr:hypothetical protein [Patescibacteria group bacterium]